MPKHRQLDITCQIGALANRSSNCQGKCTSQHQDCSQDIHRQTNGSGGKIWIRVRLHDIASHSSDIFLCVEVPMQHDCRDMTSWKLRRL